MGAWFAKNRLGIGLMLRRLRALLCAVASAIEEREERQLERRSGRGHGEGVSGVCDPARFAGWFGAGPPQGRSAPRSYFLRALMQFVDQGSKPKGCVHARRQIV